MEGLCGLRLLAAGRPEVRPLGLRPREGEDVAKLLGRDLYRAAEVGWHSPDKAP